MSWSTVVASLRLHDGTVSRAQGQLCRQHVVVASGIPSFAGPTLSLLRSASWDERQWSRQDGVKADSGFDGPVGFAAVLCREPEPLMPFFVKSSVAHRKCRRRVEHPGRTRRVRLLSLTNQGNHESNGISLEQVIDSCWGWAGGVKLLKEGWKVKLIVMKVKPHVRPETIVMSLVTLYLQKAQRSNLM